MKGASPPRDPSHPLPLLGRAPFPDVLSLFFFQIKPKTGSLVSVLKLRPPSPGLRGRAGGKEARAAAGAALQPPPPPPPRGRSPAHPSSSRPRPPGRPTPPTSAPGRAAPARGAPAGLRPAARGSRAAAAGGPGTDDPRGLLGPRRRRPRLPSPRSRARPPRHRKCRRLGSSRLQFKLSPPPPPLPPGPPPPRPGPAVAPTPPPLAAAPAWPQGVPPARSAAAAAPRARSRRPAPGGPELRLTHGAAVDAPLLSSSGSRTDRHPLPLRDQPGSGAARDSPRPPTPVPRRSRPASLPGLRSSQHPDSSSGSRTPPAPAPTPAPSERLPGRAAAAEISRDFPFPASPPCSMVGMTSLVSALVCRSGAAAMFKLAGLGTAGATGSQASAGFFNTASNVKPSRSSVKSLRKV